MQAKPIWINGKECEMNVHAVFSTTVKNEENCELHVAGTAFYRIYVNDDFLAAGPARTARGYVREDIFPLSAGENHIVIEAVGYYCHSLCSVMQPSCIIAEVQCNDKVLAYTGKDFEGFQSKCKVQKAERYSVQRHFTEVWDYRNEMVRTDIEVITEPLQILERRAPYPLYKNVDLQIAKYRGKYVFDEKLPHKKWRYSWSEIKEDWGAYKWEEIPYHPFSWVQCLKQEHLNQNVTLPITLSKGEYVIFDFERVEAGFIRTSIESVKESDIVIGFSEYYQGETFQFQNMNVHNVIEYFFPEGEKRETQSFEPYSFRYIIVAVKEGQIRLDSFGVKTYMFDIRNVEYLNTENEVLNAIYRAAVRTFAHNAVDIYSDCPSRERAGCLCDSYFSAKTEYSLTGQTKVEDAFLENYRLYKNRGEYPKGVIPESFPTDGTPGGQFIPQWTMWYILQVEEYINKRGHQHMKEAFRESIYGLLEFYQSYENDDGLLEKLPSWNFIEWGTANKWTQDVNYPTQFLYAQVLESVYKIYGDEKCKRRCNEVRQVAVEQSFNGQYFLDHAIRDENGTLIRQDEHCSEACQYYAVLFGGIDLDSEKFQELKHLILNVFDPDRKDIMTEIYAVNAFIGAYLRLETLLQIKEYHLALDNVEKFFGKMAEYTGTLWEYRNFVGSYDHGFASYALVVIKEAKEEL